MIEELTLRDLGVIRDTRLTLRPGLTVITGETGAGKTMLLTGIDLVRGGRPDPARVRPGAERAEVEAILVLPDIRDVHEAVAEAGAELDDGALVVGRTVPVEGRARARMGGRTVPSATLADVVGALVAVHGQGDQVRLARSDVQRQVLDRVAGESVAAPLGRYRELLAELREIEAEITDVRTRSAERAAEADRLRMLVTDAQALGASAGESETLAAEAERLGHAESLRMAASSAHEALSADATDTDAVGLVVAARRALEAQRSHDPLLGELADRLGATAAQLSEAAADLAAYVASVDDDPVRLDAVLTRRSEFAAFERRHGRSVEDVAAELPELIVRLEQLEGGEERLAALSDQAAGVRTAIAPVAVELHESRMRVGVHLADVIGAELTALAMPHAHVTWRVELSEPGSDALELPDGRRAALGAHGIDEVELLLSAHRDAPPLPLARAASGGELSRVMLALEVVLAGHDPVPTMVFDEVDAGVGGRAAVEVGRRLAALARTTQVLVVTHLAQVAAFADQHLVVSRRGDDEVTTSDVLEVEGDERVRELARMLAGLDDSASAADHARELLELAAESRSNR